MANKTPDTQEPLDTPAGPLGEISQGPGAFEVFLDAHHKKLLAVGIAGVLGLAGYLVYDGIREGRETAGANALQKADDLASLQEILKNHGESRAAGSAAMLLAEKQWDEGQQDAAVATLRTFIDSAGDHPAKPAARASLGSKLAAQGKAGEAADAFRALADDKAAGTYLAPFALIGLGDLAQAAGNIEEAEGHFSRVRNEFSTSPFSDVAAQRIATLHAAMPTEVEPPAPEPTTIPEAPPAPETPPAPEPAPEAEPAPTTPPQNEESPVEDAPAPAGGENGEATE